MNRTPETKTGQRLLPTYIHTQEGIREAGIFIVLVNASTPRPARPTQDEMNIHCPHRDESGLERRTLHEAVQRMDELIFVFLTWDEKILTGLM